MGYLFFGTIHYFSQSPSNIHNPVIFFVINYFSFNHSKTFNQFLRVHAIKTMALVGEQKTWIALIITSIGFELMHLANPEIEKY